MFSDYIMVLLDFTMSGGDNDSELNKRLRQIEENELKPKYSGHDEKGKYSSAQSLCNQQTVQ
jgi:hypothetical protein